MIEAKLRQEGAEIPANLIKTNKIQIKEYFEEQEWTVKEMTGHTWRKDFSGDSVYGPSDYLVNTQGIWISIKGKVCICYWDDHGPDMTYPRIYCSAKNGFDIEY